MGRTLAIWSCRSLLVAGAAITVATASAAGANGGAVFYKERIRDYSVSVGVDPPEPEPGLVRLSVTVQAFSSTNGDEGELVPIATELILTATGRGPDRSIIGPIEPQPVLLGISHFDTVLSLSDPGVWVFRLEISGAIGAVTADVPLEVVAKPIDAEPIGSPGASSNLLVWLSLGLLVTAAGVISAWALGRRRPPTGP